MTARHIDPAEFSRLSALNKPLLVDYWAPWCPYCVKITEAYDQIAALYGDQIEVVKMNIDDHEAFSDAQGIDIIPTLVLYQHGEALSSVTAPESRAAIEEFLGDTLKKAQRNREARLYDVAIIGGGPGGYTAALYAARAGLSAVVIEKLSAGGQMALTEQIDNYPGFPEGVNGYELAQNMKKQAERFGVKTVNALVKGAELAGNPKLLHTSDGDITARTVIIATGANPRKLGLPMEDQLVGRGVAYCASCDGMFYRDQSVVVVGGGDSAVAEALHLSRIARDVTLIHRRDTLRAAKVYHDQLLNTPNIRLQWNSVVEEILHDELVTGVKIRNVQTNEESILPCTGVFVSVGRVPESRLFASQLQLDEGGYIVAGESTHTSLPGVFAVGDVRTKALRQVVTAVADGATAVHSIEEYLAHTP